MTPDMMDEEGFVPRRSSWRTALSQLPGYARGDGVLAAVPAGAARRAVSLWEEGEALEDIVPESPDDDVVAGLEEPEDDEPLDEAFEDDDLDGDFEDEDSD